MRTLTMVLSACLTLIACGKSDQASVVSAAPAPLTGAQLCTRDLQKFIQFNDPASVRINSVEPNDQRPGRYYMSVSAKNGYGGYGAPTTCTCGTDVPAGTVTDLHCDSPNGV